MQALQRPPAVSSSRGRLRLRMQRSVDLVSTRRGAALKGCYPPLTPAGEGESALVTARLTPRGRGQGAHQAPCRWTSGIRSSPPSSVDTTNSSLVIRTGGPSPPVATTCPVANGLRGATRAAAPRGPAP